MRGYGRDYNDRNWIDRAGETVRGWFGGGRDYDRDYGPGDLREWQHGRGMQGGGMQGGYTGGGQMQGGGMGGYRTNNWSNTRSSYDNVYRAGGYYNADYDNAGGRGSWNAGQGGYDRDMGGGGSWQPVRPGNSGYGGGMNRGGMQGDRMQGRGGMQGGGMQGRGGMQGGPWTQPDYGGSGAGSDWGDYNQGGYGGGLFRNSSSGGVEPGRYFRGYGNGSTGGNGYEPY